MKPIYLFFLASLLFAGRMAAQQPQPEWQAEVDKLKTLITTDPAQASEMSDELLKGKNKKNLPLALAVARAYLEADKPTEALAYLDVARKVDAKSAQVSLLEGDIALNRQDVGQACQLYEQAIYFDPDCKEGYLKYAAAYRSVSPTQALEKLQQLKQRHPDCLEADRGLAEVYYASNRFPDAIASYSCFIDTPLATDDDRLKYAFALFLNHDFERSLQVVQAGLQKNARHAAFNRLAMYNNTDLQRYADAERAAAALFTASDNAVIDYLDHRYYGALLAGLQHYDRAIEQYLIALKKDEKHPDLWREISDIYEEQNRYGSAIEAYRHYYDALQPEARNAETLFQLGRLYYGEGTLPDSLAQAQNMASQQDDAQVNVEAGTDTSLLSARQRTALLAADSIFTLITEQAPDSYLGGLWRARTHSALDPETTEGLARPYYEQVMNLLVAKADPRYNAPLIECYSYMGYYHLLKSEYPDSKQYWEKILVLDPQNATATRALEGLK